MKPEMTCPRCGAPMNHQANKLVEPTTREEAESSGALGGILVTVFACPSCGFIASRRDGSEDP